jgi:hypothetical protein
MFYREDFDNELNELDDISSQPILQGLAPESLRPSLNDSNYAKTREKRLYIQDQAKEWLHQGSKWRTSFFAVWVNR